MSGSPNGSVVPRVLVGGVTHNSARLRIEGWRSAKSVDTRPANAKVEITPPGNNQELPGYLVDLSGLTPNTVYEVAAMDAPLVRLRTAPARLEGSTGLLLGLSSCYFPSEQFQANPALVAAVLANRDHQPATGESRPIEELRIPHAFFLCGDQVYSDLGNAFSFGPDVYERTYRNNWSAERLGSLFSLGGTYLAPDDHEYWNGFPERMFYLSKTYDGSWEETARKAARENWRQQAVWNFAKGVTGGAADHLGWCHGKLGDVDFFVADLRSDRTSQNAKRRPRELRLGLSAAPAKTATLFDSRQLKELLDWIKGLTTLGILVLPQPLLVKGGTLDPALDNFPNERKQLIGALRQAVLAGKSLLLLSGDIHWGRLTQWVPENGSPGRLTELVASPIARIGTGFSGLKSFLNESYKVGDPTPAPSPEKLAKEEETPDALQLFTGLKRNYCFAASGNHFGLIDLWQAPGSRPKARFELFDFNSGKQLGRPVLATNRWGPQADCTQVLTL